MAQFRLSPAAEQDLESVWQHTAEHWGVEQADKYVDLLDNAMRILADAPKLAPACDNIRVGYRKWLVESHIVYFKITDYGIAVIRILHDRMSAQAHL